MANRISRITRRNIFETLINGFKIDYGFYDTKIYYNFWGRLNTIEFLNRIYSLKDLPSYDDRYENAESDIRVHTITFPHDYEEDWLFYDDRLGLNKDDDETLLRFLCEIFHPEVRCEEGQWKQYLERINKHLRADGYSIFPCGQISGYDIYNWRDIGNNRFKQLKASDIKIFLSFLTRNGIVLDFTNATFNSFTKDSINISLQYTYNLSKGKSLERFINDDATESEIIKLFKDFIEYYPTCSCYNTDIDEYKSKYERCKKILDSLNYTSTVIEQQGESLIEIFSSDYLAKQIRQMLDNVNKNPTDTIGKAKELIESCCKTILDDIGISYKKDSKTQELTNLVFNEFGISPKNIDKSLKQSEVIVKILANVNQIAQNIAELRNQYGSGHGKPATFKGLQPRHANLAVLSSFTLVNFLWDSFQLYKEKRQNGSN